MTAIVANESVNVDLLDTTAFIGIVASTAANSSIDGVTWTARTQTTGAWTAVAANKITAVVIGSGTQAINTSPDGVTWTNTAGAMPSAAAWSGIAWGESLGYFVAVSTTSSTAAAYSADGRSWSAATLPASANWLSVAFGNGVFVATCGASSTQAAYSTNGTSWSSATLSTSGDWRSVCWGDTGGNGTWVAVSYNSSNATYSTDNGQTWNTATLPGAAANWRAVTYGNGKFVAVALGSTRAAYSTDGITWYESVLPTSLNWTTIAYSPGLKRFATLATGSTSGCATSPNGIEWTTRTVVSATWVAMCASPLRWSSGDTLTINNGSVVTVNTNQSKFWKTITINDGELLISNTSTTTPIVFAMGRNTGGTLNAITPANGLGKITISGDWIQIGTSNGTANQTFDGLYRHHIPMLEVETGSGTGVYDIWLNVTGGYGDNPVYPTDGFNGVGAAARGKFFTQDAGVTPLAQLSVGGGSSTTTKYVTVTSTAGIYPGAAITGTGITANSVVDEVVSGTVLRLNLPTTASTGPNTYTVTNPYVEQLSSTVRFGNGTNGKIPPNGAKIRVPNICITDFTPASLMTSDRTLSAQLTMSSGGRLVADKCFFSESYILGTQAQQLELTSVGFSNVPLITETYGLKLHDVGIAVMPDRRYFTSPTWLTRQVRFGQTMAMSYVSNADIDNLNMAVSQPQALTGTASTTGVIGLSFTTNATFNNVRLYSLGTMKNLQYGFVLSDTVLNSTFSNIEVYGCGVVSMTRSNDNTFTNITNADSMFSTTFSWATGQRVNTSALTDAPLVDGTKYYFKTRAYRDWTNLNNYIESRVYSATPYLAADKFHPWSFGVVNTNTATIVPTWTQRAPSAATVTYELYRSEMAGFTARDRSTRLFSTGTAATVTMNDAGVWNAVASNNATLFVAVGNNGTTAMSGDGASTWTTRTAISGNWQAVAWNGTNFAAVGLNGTTSMTTTGAANWTTRTCITGNWKALAAGPSNQFCAVGNTDGYAMTSADSGVTWTRRDCVPGDWKAIAWNGTTYVAVGNNGTTAMTSTDGISWTARTITSGNWNAVAWNGTYFVAVGNNGTTCARSTDGTTWSSETITSGNWKSITAFGSTFCAVGCNGSTVITSTDGTNWTSQTTYGSQLLTTAGWTVNAGWTESPDDNFTHSSGTATLTHSATITSGWYYRVEWTITGRTAGSVTISLGGMPYSGITASGTWDTPAATAATAFTITPTSDFNGTISATTLRVRTFGNWSAVAAGSARYVAVGAFNTGIVTISSTDGVTWNQFTGIAGAATNGTLVAPSNGETYRYVLRKYNVRITNPVTNTGVAGQYTITTNQNFNNIAANSVVNCRGKSGSPIVVAVGSNFDASGIVAGMQVNGTGVPAGTTVLSVDSYYQITLSNNLTANLTDSTMTFGLVVGMYAFGTGIGQNARIVSIDSDTQLTLDVPHECDVSGALLFANATESAEQEAYCTGWATQRTNLCLQSSDFTNASWTKTNVTPTADAVNSPIDAYFVSGNTLPTTGDRLTATAGNGTVTQSITTLVGTTYTFSVYITANRASPQGLVSGSIGLGSATQAWTVSHGWQRISVSFTAVATSTTATITITTNGTAILAAGAQVEIGSVATPPISTTTTAVTAGGTEISAIQCWSKASAGAPRNQGVALSFTAVGLWTDIFMGTSADFTPSVANRIGTTLLSTTAKFVLNTSNGNVFKNLSQVGSAGLPSSMVSLTTSSRNKFVNFTWNVNGAGGASQYLALSNLCNDNALTNWTIKNPRNSVATIYPFGGSAGTTNNNSGLVLQNVTSDFYDLPLNNNYLGTLVKGVSGGAHAPLSGTPTTAILGTTTDGVALAYTTIYDTIFNELYFGPTAGALYLTFNASNLNSPPYTVLAGTPRFSNSGRLYLTTAGDSIEYIWPHKIIGVSAFSKLAYKTSGVDIGNDLTTGFALKVEYAIDTGSGYGTYKEATPQNLVAETLPDPAVGFNLKLKLTALANMKYSGRSTKFVVGETINGLTSGATAVVDDDENGAAGTVGTLRLSSVSGSFIPGETIRSGVTNRATNVATNTSFALGPSFTSYIDGLQIYTVIDQTEKYPAETVPLVLTGLKNPSEVRVFNQGTTTQIAGSENVTGGTFTANIDPNVYTAVDVAVLSLGYQNIRFLNQTLGTGLTIPVQQQVDRQYLNP
jgi:hypothetical protein